jgi:hypothetical protein
MNDDARSASRDPHTTDDQHDRDRASLEQIADRTSERVQPDDPFTEPPNSTVDDWLGQRVDRDAERIDRTEEGSAD